MKILLIEPYLSTSHKQWLSLLSEHLPYEVKILSLPGRNWKWRMHHAAIEIVEKMYLLKFSPDLILVSDMMDVALFRSLTYREWPVPIVMYFHENQITYPWSEDDQDRSLQRDNHYGFTNYTSALIADHVIFNSEFHRNDFLGNLGPFLAKFPNKQPATLSLNIETKSSVIAPGINVHEMDRCRVSRSSITPIILWNHRWEYDKDPDLFFSVLRQMSDEKHPFDLVILGEDHQKAPRSFLAAKDHFEDRILHFGYAPNRSEYLRWLWQSDLVLSTSKQDFFGISVIEAIYCGCFPLLPNRLAFPEHIPEHLREDCLYTSTADLKIKLRKFLAKEYKNLKSDQVDLRSYVTQYDMGFLVEKYQQLFEIITKS